MRRALPCWLLLLMALGGCPGDDDDDTTDADDDDTTDGPPALGVPEALADGWLYEEYEGRLFPVDYVGSPPYQWSVVDGTLPPGLTLGADGDLDGAPQQTGDYLFTARVEDAAGHEGQGEVALTVAIHPDHLFLGLYFEQWPEICLDLNLLCTPWVRIDGAGETQIERALEPALFHVGPDGVPDAGRDDDVLMELLDPAAVTFGWTPLEDPTGDGSTLFPDDATMSAEGVLTAGEKTGRGRVELSHPDHTPGHHIVFVVAPDWCPDLGC